MNRYATDLDLKMPIKNVIRRLIRLLDEDQSKQSDVNTKYVYIIFGAGAIDIEYRYSAWGFQIPYDSDNKELKLMEISKI